MKSGGAPVVFAQGRTHLYEGRSAREVTAGVRFLARAGIKELIVTNAAGSANPDFAPGSWMMITDQINLSGTTPLIGASRSLEKPTPQKIEQLVTDLIDQRIADHQLDECELTLRELKIIAERFRFTLMNMMHSRIAYPKEGKTTSLRDEALKPDVMASTKRPASAPPISAA